MGEAVNLKLHPHLMHKKKLIHIAHKKHSIKTRSDTRGNHSHASPLMLIKQLVEIKVK